MQVLLSALDVKVGTFEFSTTGNFIVMTERPLL